MEKKRERDSRWRESERLYTYRMYRNRCIKNLSLSRFVYAMRSSIARFSGIRNSSRFAREGREETGSIVQGGRRETETRKEERKEERKKENAYR